MLLEEKPDADDGIEGRTPRIELAMMRQYIGFEIDINRGGESARGKTVKRARTEIGEAIETRYSNPLHDTRQYEVDMGDGVIEKYFANQIAENIYNQGRKHTTIGAICGHHKSDEAVPMDKGFYQSHCAHQD